MNRFLPLLLLVALGAGGCASNTFTARRTSTPAQTAAAGDPAADLRLLVTPGADDAHREATARVVDRYAAALLAAPDHTVRVAGGPGGPSRVRLRRGQGPGGVEPGQFAALAPVSDYTVRGPAQLDRTAGVGAPLVGTLTPTLAVSQPEPTPNKPVSGLTWAVTAVPVPTGGGTLCLDLYDPHTTGRVPAGDGRAAQPLAADYTVPAAVVTGRFRPQQRGWSGVFNANRDYTNTGLYPTEQPTPGKTPLILVHGLISDPTDLHYLSNRLVADPAVRRRYQVWVFYYPTSLPVVYSALLLREDLAKFVHQLDPAGTHPAMHRAVLVGHSMGGLLCRLAVSEGGDVYYHHFFRPPLDDLKLTPTERSLVRRAFYYHGEPDVAQVVFIATPHRGSSLASGFPGNLARLLVRVPAAVVGRITPIVSDNHAALAPEAPLKPGSSINSLGPHDPVIAAINDMPFQPGVRLHSILGDRGHGGPAEKSSDGVVPYASSHLPAAESERIVPAGHTGTLYRPETVDELRRILTADGDRSAAGASSPR